MFWGFRLQQKRRILATGPEFRAIGGSMTGLWKDNWDEAKSHHEAWWRREGLVLATWGTGLPRTSVARESRPLPPRPADLAGQHTDPDWVSARIRADMVPLCWPDLGTVSLAPYLGAVSQYGANNVWYRHTIADTDTAAPLTFDQNNPAVQSLEATVRAVVDTAANNYFTGMPALIPNLDVLAEVRGTQDLLIDMLENPAWVHEKLAEIDQAWMIAFDRMRNLIKLPDDSMAFGYFMLWGSGRTSLLQCDVSAMFSPDMFAEFVVPGLIRECAWLDHSMYHVDGHQCLGHLEHILAIDDLDAIEWTPDPQVPPGGDAHWFPVYRKILDAGKSLWVAMAKPHEVEPLLDAIGGKGVYLTVQTSSVDEMERIAKVVERFR